ncbi:AMP-binding protein [Nocardioides sp.]|uniref:AMP-binding protein n=1 Tax=Nocardioides sp. TaxID=35761 RepID=UPI0035AF5FCA
MAYIPVTRAPALPTDAVAATGAASQFSTIQEHARTRGDDIAYVVQAGQERAYRTWAQVAVAVERAGAGLVRSGLRADQVVVSLLPAGHAWPELDLALQAIGAVVVQVSPDATTDDLVRELEGVDVRLVVAEAEADLRRLQGLTFRSAEMFALDGGRGWDRLLTLGAERLTMDPDAVSRADRVVDPTLAGPRLLRADAGLGRVVPPADQGLVLAPDAVVVLVGDVADPTVELVRAAHVAAGCTLRHLPDGAVLAGELADLGPTVLAVSSAAAADLPLLLAASPAPAVLRRRSSRARGNDLDALRAFLGGHLDQVVAPELPDRVARVLAELDAGTWSSVADLLPADLPVPPPVLVGDSSTLPRRSRQEPGRDFQFDNDREPTVAEPEPSAFDLPSLPLFGGESFLDKLLMAQAKKGAS